MAGVDHPLGQLRRDQPGVGLARLGQPLGGVRVLFVGGPHGLQGATGGEEGPVAGIVPLAADRGQQVAVDLGGRAVELLVVGDQHTGEHRRLEGRLVPCPHRGGQPILQRGKFVGERLGRPVGAQAAQQVLAQLGQPHGGIMLVGFLHGAPLWQW